MKRAYLFGAGTASLVAMMAVWSGMGVERPASAPVVAVAAVAAPVVTPARPTWKPAPASVAAAPAAPVATAAADDADATDDTPDEIDYVRPVEPEDLAGAPSEDEIRAEEERVAAIEAQRMRERAANPRPTIDPQELGFADEASMHEAWRKKLGIPEGRTIIMRHGTREGRPVIDVLVPPVSASAD